MKTNLVSDNRRFSVLFFTALSLVSGCLLLAQAAPPLAQPGKYTGRVITGDFVRQATVNMTELAGAQAERAAKTGTEIHPNRRPLLRPPLRESGAEMERAPAPLAAEATPTATPNFRGFTGLTHLDQRNARGGNQFSTEPPDQALAVGNHLILEGVNSALNVYDTNGIQQLVRPLALSEFFRLPAGINRTTGTFGVFPGDPVALFDPETQRWFVAAWAQLNSREGVPLQQSQLYLAVSQTEDPTGDYFIYVLNTTLANNPDKGGPRIPDFPHFAVDHYGLYISINEFKINPDGTFGDFIDAAILAISKKDLINGGGPVSRVVRFPLPFSSGFEFTVFPAYTPPGCGPLLANNGTQFFVSSHFVNTTENSLAIWALTNTRSLDSPTPDLHLSAVVVNTQAFHFPARAAEQKRGFHPLGASLGEPVERLDPGDFRVISATYSCGRLWATLGSEMLDGQGTRRIVAEYFSFSPHINFPFFSATLVTQGIISRSGANLLYPAVTVNAQQKGGIVFTLVGPNDYPSAAFAPVNNTTVGPVRIARAGNEPEDGFTGYPEFGGNGVARWGDYSGAAIDTDGVTWMATEYTPDIARTMLANWCTYIIRLQP